MNKIKLIVITLLVVSMLAACGNDKIKENENNIEFPDEVIDLTREFVLDIFNERYDEVVAADMDEKMQLVMTEEQAKSIYVELISKCGFFNKIEEYITSVDGDYGLVTYICKFDLIHVNISILVDNSMRISGINYTFNKDYENNGMNEVEVSFGFEYEIYGTLSMPESETDVPCLVIAGGSGPLNRDGVIGATSPYYDIAKSLYDRDIAVLRFDKRTFTHNEHISNNLDGFTMWDEIIDDTAMAYYFAKTVDGVDKDNIYILGHSLAGYSMGRIKTMTKDDAAGYILLAANASPLEDLIVKQIDYLANLDGEITDEEVASYANFRMQRDVIKVIEEDMEELPELLLSAPASYWLDLKDYDPVAMLHETEKPILVLQGERDYQVTMDEYNMWVDGLSDKDNVTFESYPNLNHVFTSGEGDGNPDEYGIAKTIDYRVVEAIADFILGN